MQHKGDKKSSANTLVLLLSIGAISGTYVILCTLPVVAITYHRAVPPLLIVLPVIVVLFSSSALFSRVPLANCKHTFVYTYINFSL